MCSNPSTGRISFICCWLWKRGFQRADGLGLGHQKLGGNFPSGASGTQREGDLVQEGMAARDGRHTHATSGLEPTSRSADGATWTVWSGHRRRRRRRRRWTRAGARRLRLFALADRCWGWTWSPRTRPCLKKMKTGRKKKRRDHAFDVFRVSNQTFELNRLTTCLERGSNSRP